MSCDGNHFFSVRDYLNLAIGPRSISNKVIYDKMLKRRDPEDYKRMIELADIKEKKK